MEDKEDTLLIECPICGSPHISISANYLPQCDTCDSYEFEWPNESFKKLAEKAWMYDGCNK